MDEPRKSMGIGMLGQPSTLFVKKNRWTLEGEGFPEHLAAKVKVLFRAKTLIVECYEVLDIREEHRKIDIQDWSEEDFLQKSLTLTTYDGCGTPIYQYKFHNLKIRHESLEFDYACGDPMLREFHIHYGHCTREVFQPGRSINPKEDADEQDRESGDCPERPQAAKKCL
jgi:hypothetical protein